jgi:hydrogenase small subunit
MPPRLTGAQDGLLPALLERRVTRRAFLQFCAATTAVLALPAAYAPRVSAAVAAAPRIPLLWLRGQGCGGNSEALLHAANPGVAELLLDMLSIDYLETLMAPAGAAAEAARTSAMSRFPKGYIVVVEGAVSTADGGVHHLVGGRPFSDIVREVSDGALATIAVGSCAFDGGVAAAAGGTTDAVGVGSVVANPRFVALPGCPMNAANLAATLVHYLTFNQLPATDSRGRPLFAYGSLQHNLCERRPHFEFGEFVLDWGDEGAQKGWCLYKMGCKGPQAFANCATTRYDEGTSWPVQAGHGCIACTMPGFWDQMGPAYGRLPSWLPFNPDVTVDSAGMVLVGGVAALAAGHGAASMVRFRRRAAAERRLAAAAASAATVPAVPTVTAAQIVPDLAIAAVPVLEEPGPAPAAVEAAPGSETIAAAPSIVEPAATPIATPEGAATPEELRAEDAAPSEPAEDGAP